MQAQVEVESGIEEVVQVTGQEHQIILEALVSKSCVATPRTNAPEVSGSSTPGPINNLPVILFFEVRHLFASPAPHSTPFFS